MACRHDECDQGLARLAPRRSAVAAWLLVTSCVNAVSGCTALYDFGSFRSGDSGVERDAGPPNDVGPTDASATPDSGSLADAGRAGCVGAPPSRGRRLALGQFGGCVRSESGSPTLVRCWGWNANGQLGIGVADGGDVSLAASTTDVAGLAATDLDLVAAHQARCVFSGARVQCWGDNATGAFTPFGTGSTPVTTPTRSDLLPWTVVALGNRHSCRASASAIDCAGTGTDGRLGGACELASCADERIYEVDPAVDCAGGVGVVQLASGDTHTCALMRTGRLVCFGTHTSGELGPNAVGTSSGPVEGPAAPGGAGWDEVDVGRSFTCARQGVRVYCWGTNTLGELGTGGAGGPSPVLVAGLADAAQLTLGLQHACVRTAAGHVACWGRNSCGQLGAGLFSTSQAAREVELGGAGLLDRVVEVRAGHHFTCALRDDGSVWCWGADDHAQVGDPASTTQASCGGRARAQPFASGRQP